jgi:hypothetical protein
MTPIKYRTTQVDGLDVFYREAGPVGGFSQHSTKRCHDNRSDSCARYRELSASYSF